MMKKLLMLVMFFFTLNDSSASAAAFSQYDYDGFPGENEMNTYFDCMMMLGKARQQEIQFIVDNSVSMKERFKKVTELSERYCKPSLEKFIEARRLHTTDLKRDVSEIKISGQELLLRYLRMLNIVLTPN